MTLLTRVTLLVAIITLILASSKNTLASPKKTEPEHLFSKTSPTQTIYNEEIIKLEKNKLELEVEKLRLENLNRNRNLLSVVGWINLLFGSGSVIIAIVLGFGGLYRYLEERREELKNREDERFEAIVKSLGGEHEKERVNAAVLLPTAWTKPELQKKMALIIQVGKTYYKKGKSGD